MTPGLPSCKIDSLQHRFTLSAQQPAFVSTVVHSCIYVTYALIGSLQRRPVIMDRKIPVKCQHTQAVTSVTLHSSQNLSPRALVGFLICVSEVWGLVKRGKAGKALKGKAVTVGLWYMWVQLNVLNFIVHHIVLLKVTYLSLYDR